MKYIVVPDWRDLGKIVGCAAIKISRELKDSDLEAEERLQAKCQWEHMSRTAVILEWGDPREWVKEAE